MPAKIPETFFQQHTYSKNNTKINLQATHKPNGFVRFARPTKRARIECIAVQNCRATRTKKRRINDE